jgi:hypothetical protein
MPALEMRLSSAAAVSRFAECPVGDYRGHAAQTTSQVVLASVSGVSNIPAYDRRSHLGSRCRQDRVVARSHTGAGIPAFLSLSLSFVPLWGSL